MIHFLLIEQATYAADVLPDASPRTYGNLYPTREQAERAQARDEAQVAIHAKFAPEVTCTHTIVEVEVPDYI